jgi:hypothetical protein
MRNLAVSYCFCDRSVRYQTRLSKSYFHPFVSSLSEGVPFADCSTIQSFWPHFPQLIMRFSGGIYSPNGVDKIGKNVKLPLICSPAI